MHRIADSIEKYIFQHHLMIKGETYLVGLSGGADSVALICLLHIHIKDGIIGKIEENFDHTARPFGINGVMK